MKRLIVCCDGTWNDLEMAHPTNVVKLATRVKHVADDGWEQVVYYDAGVGTGRILDKFFGGVTGKGLVENIREAYRFLCLNYNQDDEVYLFGFSRGAYTVRSLAGMIGFSGLLRRSRLRDLPYAYSVYKKGDKKGASRLLDNNWGPIPIKALGCWDTVGTLGIPDKTSWLDWDKWSRKRHAFHDTEVGPHVENAFHAVAIDEIRKEFLPTPMRKSRHNSAQMLKEKWFSGDHGCVGGGTEEKRELSNIPLKWLAREVKMLGLDIKDSLFDLPAKAGLSFEPAMRFFYSEAVREVNCPEQDLHESVLQRWGERADYRPSNLLQFSDFLDSESRTRITSEAPLYEMKQAGTRV